MSHLSFTDSHAHLSSIEGIPLIENLIERAKKEQVARIVNICTDVVTLEAGIELNRLYPFIKNAGATTPHDVESEGESAFSFFEKAAKEKKLCAIGETGLDYHYQYSPKELQKKFLIRYLHLAEETNLPVIFHCREAFLDLFRIVDLEYPSKAQAILHCFTGTMSEAEAVLERGWYLSLSGIVTFKKSEALREVAKRVPLSQLLIETDTPYLAPQSQRGKMNEPSFLPEIARCIAEVKGVSVEDVAKATSDNAQRLFFSDWK